MIGKMKNLDAFGHQYYLGVQHLKIRFAFHFYLWYTLYVKKRRRKTPKTGKEKKWKKERK
jgi:hypothetical protein